MENKEMFYKKTWFMYLMLFIFPPIGFIFLWQKKEYSTNHKWILTGIFSLWLIFAYFNQDEAETEVELLEEELESAKQVEKAKEEQRKAKKEQEKAKEEQRKAKKEQEKAKEEQKKAKENQEKVELKESEGKNSEKVKESWKDPRNKQDIFQDEIVVNFATDISQPNYAISDIDYKKYTEILNYLYKYPNKAEDQLFKELESIYDESAAELNEFAKVNMQDAIARDSGETTNKVSLETTDIEDVIKVFFNENIKVSNLLDVDPNKADIKITNRRSISKGELLYDSVRFSYILKMEHADDFQKTNVFQLKIDNVNIDLDD